MLPPAPTTQNNCVLLFLALKCYFYGVKFSISFPRVGLTEAMLNVTQKRHRRYEFPQHHTHKRFHWKQWTYYSSFLSKLDNLAFTLASLYRQDLSQNKHVWWINSLVHKKGSEKKKESSWKFKSYQIYSKNQLFLQEHPPWTRWTHVVPSHLRLLGTYCITKKKKIKKN